MALTDLSVFFQRPDARQIATFFLGGVFIESLRCIVVSPFFRFFVKRPGSLHSSPESISEKSTLHTSKAGRHVVHLALDMLLPISFCVSALSHFSSLLALESTSAMGCAFVVALGGISQQLARLVASVIILVDLHQVLHKFELFGSIFWILLGGAAAFADNALSTGFLQSFPPLNVSFCLRKRLLAPAAVAFALYLVIQLYFIIRIWMIFRQSQRSTRVLLTDARMMRPVTLILFEALALIPSVAVVDSTGEFIPFSVGVLLVLAAFTAKSKLSYTERQPQPEQVIDIIPRPWSRNPSPRVPSWNPNPAPQPNRDRERLSAMTDTFGPSGHPFAASSLRDKSMLHAGYRTPDRRVSHISSGTTMTSTEEGVVQTIDQNGAPIQIQAKLVATTPTSALPSAPPQSPWTHRRIATPDQLNSFATQQQQHLAKPAPRRSSLVGIPPPPLSARRPPPPEITAPDAAAIEGPLSSRSSRIYGSDIIRMTSNSSFIPWDATKRQTMDTLGTPSHLSYVSTQQTHDDYYSPYANPRESHSTFGGSRHPSVRRGSMTDGRRKSSLRSKRATAASLGQLDLPPIAATPPPLPPSILSARPLPATPTDFSMR